MYIDQFVTILKLALILIIQYLRQPMNMQTILIKLIFLVDKIYKKMSTSDLNISRWLEAHCDRSAGLMTLPRNVILADVAGDRDYRLVLTDLKLEGETKSRLKTYKGTLLTSDQVLPDTPSSIISFYSDELEQRISVVAVGCGSELLVYKNTKPFFKFSIPPAVPLPIETEIWRKLEGHDTNYQEMIVELKTVPFRSLSARSQQLLTLPDDKIDGFVAKFAGTEPVKATSVICMATLNKSTKDQYAPACPVLGTESGEIYILDPQSFTILHQASVCNAKSTPYIINTTGTFDVEFRIIVACREKIVCLLRRGWLEGKCLIQLTEDIVDFVIVPGDNFIIIATSNKMLTCYTKRGVRVWSSNMVNFVTCLCLVPLKHLTTHLVAVGLRGGFVHLYHGRHPVDFISTPDTPSALIFGQLGQEEHVLVIITLNGTINFKILKRTADFNLGTQDKLVSPNLQSKPLPLPKRSKLFLEQSLRERQNAIEMHRNFQQDLLRLRVTAAQALVQTLSDQTGTGNELEQIKLTAQVLGLGPRFTLVLTLENINTLKPVVDFFVIFHAKPTHYVLSSYVVTVPLVPPGLSYKIEAKVTEIVDDRQMNLKTAEFVRVFVNRMGQAQPVLAATIKMPPTEMIELF